MSFLCPTWSFDTTRVITGDMFPFEKETVVMQRLVPTSPVAEMTFPVRTAYDPSNRAYYTLATGRLHFPPLSGSLWSQVVSNDVGSVNVTATPTVTLPSTAGVAWLEAFAGKLYAGLTDGTLVQLNTTTSAPATVLTNVLQDNNAPAAAFLSTGS